MVKKRLTFKCWNCQRTYSLLRELTGKEKLFAACPYCGAEAVVDLDAYASPALTTYKHVHPGGGPDGFVLDLPDVLPTRQPTEKELNA